jgi:hypothetical protein
MMKNLELWNTIPSASEEYRSNRNRMPYPSLFDGSAVADAPVFLRTPTKTCNTMVQNVSLASEHGIGNVPQP